MEDWKPSLCQTVVFEKDGHELWGRVVAGPKGRHRVYRVRASTGDVADVPVALLSPERPS